MKNKLAVFIIFMLAIALLLSSKVISAAKTVFVTEVQTGSVVSASEEFVEIYNSGLVDTDISGWSMYYKSATGTTWIKKATVVSGTIKSKDFWVFSANLPGNTTYSSGLSGTGGNIQIKDKAGVVIDQFGWGNANASLGSPASASGGGQSMYRLYSFDSGFFQNTDNNFSDFDIADIPTPANLPTLEVPEPDTEPEVYPALELSELFPDPQSPLSDTIDEFIEIYNPNNHEVDLSGWSIIDEGGAKYLLKGVSINSKSYFSIPVKDSKITLNNTGDVIQLIDPNGKIRDESADYEIAEPGLSWSKTIGVWQWAVVATPNAANADAYVEDVINPVKAVSKVSKASTKKPASKSSTSKTSTSKKSDSSKINSTASKNTSSPVSPEAKSKTSSGWWAWLLLAAGIATIGYAIYEYRTEIQLFFKKLRRH